MHGHPSSHQTSPARERRKRNKNAEELLAEALAALRAVRANYKAWRELWPHEQHAVCAAGETLEAEIRRRG